MIIIKILLAINNKEIKSRIDKKYGNRVYNHDIDCMENAIEFLSNRRESYIVITRDTLQGNIDKKLYIKQLRVASKSSKIVYIVDKLTQEYKEFLFANEVFNIIEGKNINFDVLTNYIDNPQNVVYKTINNADNYINSKKVIGICGTNGVGKSLVSSFIANELALITKDSILLADMDIKNPSIDILNNIDSNNKSFYQYFQDKDGDINNYIIKKGNLNYMVNKPAKNYKLNQSKLEEIYNYISNNYIYSFIDLSSNNSFEYTKFWLKKVTDIIVIVNPNYLNIRESLRYIKELKKSNVFIIVNSIKQGSLDISQVNSLLSEYKIVGKIYYGKNVEKYINGAIPKLELEYDFCKLYKEFGLENKGNKKNNHIQVYKKLRKI